MSENKCNIQWTKVNTPGLVGSRYWECSTCGYTGDHDAHPGCQRTLPIPPKGWRVEAGSKGSLLVCGNGKRIEIVQGKALHAFFREYV